MICRHLWKILLCLLVNRGYKRHPGLRPRGTPDLWLCLAGSSVAQLKATDPEGEPLVYGVSGEEAMRYFSVNKDTGVVWLRQQLDREVRTPKEKETECKWSNAERGVKNAVLFRKKGWKIEASEFSGILKSCAFLHCCFTLHIRASLCWCISLSPPD